MPNSIPIPPAISGAALEGRWQFQLCEQTIRLPSGEVLEVIRQKPPQASYRFLEVTARELIFTHEYGPDGVAALGKRYYEVIRAYYREGDRLFIIPAPGIAPRPELIQRLDDHQLILTGIGSAPGGPVTEVARHFSR